MGLLACCLIDGRTMVECLAAGISHDSFYDARNAAIFAAMCDLHAGQHPITGETLGAQLDSLGKLAEVGGFSYMLEVSSSAQTTLEAPLYIQKVAEYAVIRKLIRGSAALIESCHAFNGDMEDEVSPKVDELVRTIQRSGSGRTWAQAVDEAEALTRERMKPEAERSMGGRELSWGMADLDRFFGPIEPGELVVIGGYTSSGKSSLLRQVLWQMVRAGFPAMIETIEARDAEEAINLAGHISGLRSRARLDQLHREDQKELLASFEMMRKAPFAVCHSDHSMAAMLARATAFKRKNGLFAWGADYLQIMEDVKNPRKGEREDSAIGRVTAGMKQFSTSEGVATFLLSGFNRDYTRNESGRDPRLSDLAGSSSIEKDASRVILLHIPIEYTVKGAKLTQSLTADADVQPNFHIKLIQAKGRNQGTASVALQFHRETKTFTQLTR